MTVGGKRIHERISGDVSNLARVSKKNTVSNQTLDARTVKEDLPYAAEENERFQREVEVLTGNMQIPGPDDFRTKDAFETGCVSIGKCGIVDHGGCVDNVLDSTELRVDVAQSDLQGQQVTNIDLSITALASCTRRKARKFFDNLSPGLRTESKKIFKC